jgi:hypothetical protein
VSGTGEGSHFCPGCGRERAFNPRYPWHLCAACLARATDGDGRAVEFSNASFSGGLIYRLAGTKDWSEDVGLVRCLIGGRPVLVQEAHMGGVVAQPLTRWPLEGHETRICDLAALRRR